MCSDLNETILPDDVVLSISGLSKSYRLYDSHKHRILDMLVPGRSYGRDFFALKDVNFELKRGDNLGILGCNGSGKSTLLQIISGTTPPTEGTVKVRGRVGALLELGSGFSPEFTGKENIYLTGSVLGLSRREIDAKFDEIVEFADIGDFLYQPVKSYSSGMAMRLAFALQTSIEPDLLIVDEALAVGDLSFQIKCIQRIRTMIDNGAALLLVTHVPEMTQKLCHKGLWLDKGHMAAFGEIGDVVSKYNTHLKQLRSSGLETKTQDSQMVRVYEVRFNGQLQLSEVLEVKNDQHVSLDIDYYCYESIDNAVFGVAVHDMGENYITGHNTRLDNFTYNLTTGPGRVTIEYPSLPLQPGDYSFTVGVFESDAVIPYSVKYNALRVRVAGEYTFAGFVNLPHLWQGPVVGEKSFEVGDKLCNGRIDLRTLGDNRPWRIGMYFAEDKMDYNPNYRPIAAGLLKSSIEQKFPGAAEYFVCADFDDPRLYKADILLASSYSQDWGVLLETLKRYRKYRPDGWVVVGGQHITQLPETLPETADFGLRGEGEVALPELIKQLSLHGVPNSEQLEPVSGLLYQEKETNGFVSHPVTQLTWQEIPLPDRFFDGGDKYDPYLLTSRGCPFVCAFCSSAKIWKKVTYQPAEGVVEQLSHLSTQYPDLTTINIWDDLFTGDRKRLRKIAELLSRHGLLGRFKLSCSVRADLVDEELCGLMKDLNVVACGFGFESGSDRILKILKPQGNCSVANNMAAIKLLSKFGFDVSVSAIFGSPGETETDVRKTYELILGAIKDGGIQAAAFNILMPLPGTYYWGVALEKGLVSNSHDFEWSRLRYYADYINSSFKSFDDWAEARLKNHSPYLNEKCLPELQLIEMMREYDKIRRF